MLRRMAPVVSKVAPKLVKIIIHILFVSLTAISGFLSQDFFSDLPSGIFVFNYLVNAALEVPLSTIGISCNGGVQANQMPKAPISENQTLALGVWQAALFFRVSKIRQQSSKT